jgi:hypothetical protein
MRERRRPRVAGIVPVYGWEPRHLGVGVMLGVRAIASSSMRMMRGGFDILVTVLFGSLAVTLGGLLVVDRSRFLMVGDLRGASPDRLGDGVSAGRLPGGNDRGASVAMMLG